MSICFRGAHDSGEQGRPDSGLDFGKRLVKLARMHLALSVLRASLAAATLGTAGCATHFGATTAKFGGPDYVVTQAFYAEAPQRLSVLPFATRTGAPADMRKAEVCRRVFFQHLSVRAYEGLGLRKSDLSLFPGAATNRESRLKQVVDVMRRLDVVGMTTVFDLQALFRGERTPYPDFLDTVRAAHEELHADAFVVGITRSYGRFYAGVISSIGLSTRVEMRSATTGNLLWRGEQKRRRFELPLTLNPLDIPRLLFDVWRHSRGLALDSLAYQVYGDLVASVPYVPRPRQVFVETGRPYTPYFDAPTIWFLFPRGRAAAGARFPFHLEQKGWFECQAPDGRFVWIYRDHARLVDQDGAPVNPAADLQW
jgi:hypothetical protein